jgi:hypothetical protein
MPLFLSQFSIGDLAAPKSCMGVARGNYKNWETNGLEVKFIS